jgi:hypothetical protein
MQENIIENMKTAATQQKMKQLSSAWFLVRPWLKGNAASASTLEKFATMKVERRRRRLQACGIQVRQTRRAAPREPETTASTQIDEEIETTGVGQNSGSLKP